MDVISPELVWMDGICYRINDFHEMEKQEEFQTPIDDYSVITEEDIDNLEFVTCNNGRIKTSLHVALAYIGYIIGTKHSMTNRIMNETHTVIKLPPRGKQGDIIIIGPNKKNVSSAVRRINMIVLAARQKQKPTHFISIPVNSDEIINNYKKFMENILSNNSFEGVDDSIFTEPPTLHLTLHVLALMDNEERLLAIKLLEEAKKEIVDPLLKNKPIPVCLTGVSYMNDDPKATHVLYAEVKEKNDEHRGILSELSQQLVTFFNNNGFESNQPQKLHVTLMNSRKRYTEDEGKDNVKRKPFDASTILTDYRDYHFGEHLIDKIHLSQMSARGPDKYYQATSIIDI